MLDGASDQGGARAAAEAEQAATEVGAALRDDEIEAAAEQLVRVVGEEGFAGDVGPPSPEEFGVGGASASSSWRACAA